MKIGTKLKNEMSYIQITQHFDTKCDNTEYIEFRFKRFGVYYSQLLFECINNHKEHKGDLYEFILTKHVPIICEEFQRAFYRHLLRADSDEKLLSIAKDWKAWLNKDSDWEYEFIDELCAYLYSHSYYGRVLRDIRVSYGNHEWN